MNNFLDTLQNNRKYLFFGIGAFLMLIFVLILLIPGSNTTDTANKPLAGDNLETEIIWWRPFHTQQTYQKVFDEFRKTYPNVRITVVNKPYGADYYKELIADIARGAGPDVFVLDDNDLPAYKDFVHPVSLFQGNVLSEYQDNFADLVVKNSTDRDDVYGIATELENLQLYYNKDILAQNGIALPPTTWKQMADQSQTLTRLDAQSNLVQSAISLGHGGTRTNRQIGNIEQYEDIIPLFLMQGGNSIYDKQDNNSTLGNNPDNSFEALNTYLQFANPSKDVYTWSGTQRSNIELFAEGKLAYMINYSYTANQLKEKNPRLNFSVAPIPQMSDQNKKTYGTFLMSSINRNLATQAEKDGKSSNSARKLAVIENFLYFLSLPENQALVSAQTQTPSANRKVLAQQQQSSGEIRVFANGALYADSYYQPCVTKIESLWTDLFYNVNYQYGLYKDGSSSSRDKGVDERELALKNAFQETKQNYQNILQTGACLR